MIERNISLYVECNIAKMVATNSLGGVTGTGLQIKKSKNPTWLRATISVASTDNYGLKFLVWNIKYGISCVTYPFEITWRLCSDNHMPIVLAVGQRQDRQEGIYS